MAEKGPLDGVLVIALEQAVAAPYCTSRLADAGARVIKIERAEGDFARGYDDAVHGQASYFVWLNRGKESIVLDIKRAEDCALLARMIAAADVFVQNLAPGAAARAGFGAEALRRRHPGLITCDISGYGEDNACSHLKAYDLLVQAETGLCSQTGGPEEPARVGVSVCDIAAGMYAQSAILEALIRRGRSGEGEALKVSLFDGMADWMAVPLLQYLYGGKAPERVGLMHPTVAPYEAHRTKDGRDILISIQNEREWARFCDLILGQPELSTGEPFGDNVLRTRNRDALIAVIDQAFARSDASDLKAKLDAADTAYGEIRDVAGLAGHPAFRRVSVETPHGRCEMPAPPARRLARDGTEAAARPGPVPAIGSHSDAIRREFSD